MLEFQDRLHCEMAQKVVMLNGLTFYYEFKEYCNLEKWKYVFTLSQLQWTTKFLEHL